MVSAVGDPLRGCRFSDAVVICPACDMFGAAAVEDWSTSIGVCDTGASLSSPARVMPKNDPARLRKWYLTPGYG